MAASFLGAIVSGCSSSETKVEKAKADLKEARAELNQEQKDSVADYVAFKSTSEERIASNEKSIQAFKDRMKTDMKKVKKADQEMVDKLEQRNIDMRKKMDEYKADGKDNWEAFKKEFNHDMDDLGASLKNLTVKNTR